MNRKRQNRLWLIFFSLFFLLLANSCGEGDDWEDYRRHENINEVEGIAVFPSGEIIIIGYIVLDDDNGASLALVKYLENGLLDSSFGNDGVVFLEKRLSNYESLDCNIATTEGGNIIFTASCTPDRGNLESIIVQYSSNGIIDGSFGNMGVKKYSSVAIHSLTLMENNNILISGAKSFETVAQHDFFVSQLDQLGEEVVEFANEGIKTIDFNAFNTTCKYQRIQENGKILLTGNTAENQNTVPMLRLHPNGSLDTTFSGDGKIVADIGYKLNGKVSLNKLENDKYLLVSRINYYDVLFASLLQDGSLDSEFGQEGMVTNMCFPDNPVSVRTIFIQENGNYLLVGQRKSNVVLVELLPNGELNSTFGENGIASNSFDGLNSMSSFSITIGAGKIIIAGEIDGNDSFLDQDTDFCIIRFNEDGSIDDSFGTNGMLISDIL